MISSSSRRFLAGLTFLTVSAFAQAPGRVHLPHVPFRPPSGVNLNASAPPATAVSVGQMRSIYGVNQLTNYGQGQTIAIVIWYDDPNIESDFGVFNSFYQLPACTTANGCFKKIFSGTTPKTDAGVATEIAIDVSWAHAMAPAARIILIEAPNSFDSSLLHAIDVAVASGATVVNMSWGGPESRSDRSYDSHFNKPGVTFVAASGDNGHGVSWPASSPYVVAVGGTTLTYNQGAYVSESAWSGSGGGVSRYEAEPSYQTSFQNYGGRGVPDVAFDADPKTGVAIYDSIPYQGTSGWSQWGGTSIGAPQISGIIAVVNSERAAAGKNPLQAPGDLYQFVADYHDITTGSNGRCFLCSATAGYDYVTGVGSPEANVLVPALVSLP